MSFVAIRADAPAAPRPFRKKAVTASSLRCRFAHSLWFRPPGHFRAPSDSTPGCSTARLFPPRQGALVRDLRPFRAPASPVRMRAASTKITGVQAPAAVPSSGQPSAGLSPPGAPGAFPPNKGKAVARLSTAPRSGCLPLPLPSHTRSRGETRPEIPPDPRGGT